MNGSESESLENQLIGAALDICQEQEIRLSDQAERFLRVAAEALIKEPPESQNPRFITEEFNPGSEAWLSIGLNIFKAAVEDSRIGNEMRARSRVSFPTLAHVLLDSGHRYLLSIGFKS